MDNYFYCTNKSEIQTILFCLQANVSKIGKGFVNRRLENENSEFSILKKFKYGKFLFNSLTVKIWTVTDMSYKRKIRNNSKFGDNHSFE